MGTVGETEEVDARNWQQPLLEDALFRAKRLQQNAERNALKRKGDYYGEWRDKWARVDLPPLVAEILEPVIDAIAGERADVMRIAQDLIFTEKSIEAFAMDVLGGLND